MKIKNKKKLFMDYGTEFFRLLLNIGEVTSPVELRKGFEMIDYGRVT